jgi:anaerobic selenocysteine-containing dehydrogenase
MMETHKTFCRNCGALCAMEIDVEDGRMVRARPDDSVAPAGGYMCPKGLAAIDFCNGAENRLMQSVRRKPDGMFAPVGNDEALAQIGGRIARIVAEHGPRSVAVYHGTGAYRSVLGGLMERAWVAAIGTPNFFSSMTIDQSAHWVTMARMGVMASGKHSIRDADVILLAGGNPLVSHQGAPFAVAEAGAPARAFEDAKRRGAKIIIVDPRRTETARFADLHIQPLPGHDAELFAAIVHLLLRDGTYDRAFVDRWCNGVKELEKAVAPFTPELAAARCDVPVEQIELAAKWLGEGEKVLVGSGTGPCFSRHSNTADHMIEAAGALCGGFRREGDRIRNPGTLKTRQAFEMAVSPTRSFEQEPKCVSENTGQLYGEMPTALLAREITADSPDRIRVLINFGGDVMTAMGDPAVAKPAFEQLDLLVSLDCRMNETCKASDYVIATSQPFERHEITIPGDALWPEPFVQYTRPVVEKPEGTIHDWEFFWAVSGHMGVPLTFKFWNYGLKFDEIPGGLPLDMEERPDPEELCRFLASDSAVPFDELLANPGGVRPELEPQFVQPAPAEGGRLELCPPDLAAELAQIKSEGEEEGFAYRLTCRRILHAINGAYRESKGARKRYPVNWAHMNPDDMARDGIAEGAPVTIASQFGEIRTLAKAEDRVRPGVVSMTHMFGPLTGSGDPQADGGANVGQLVSLSEVLEPINFMPRFSGIPVNVTAGG